MDEFIEYTDAGSPRSYPPIGNRGESGHSARGTNLEHVETPKHSHSEHAEHAEFAHSEHAEHAEHVEDNAHVEHAEHAEHADHAENAEHVEDNAHVEHAGTTQSGERPPMRRRSTIMLNEDEGQAQHMEDTNHLEDEGPYSRAQEGDQVDLTSTVTSKDTSLVETVIEWKEGGHSVFVTGSFTGWKQMIPLRRFDDDFFAVVLKLSSGTHRLRFVVDGELRCSDSMNTATDSMGNLVNYIEVHTDEMHVDGDEQFDDYESPIEHEYTREIPDIFADPDALDRFSSIEFTPPPQLPPHLDGVILNTNWTEKDNNSVLPIPNHVVLNHLATTSIKHNVLAVASVSRYRAKYITQVLYSPINGV